MLEFGPLGDLPPHADENVTDLVLEERQRVPGPHPAPLRERGDVDPLGFEPGSGLRCDELFLACRECLVHLATRLPDELAECGFVFGGDVAHAGVECGERRALSGVRGAGGFEFGGIGGRGDRGQSCGHGGIDRFGGDQGSIGHDNRVYRRWRGIPSSPQGGCPAAGHRRFLRPGARWVISSSVSVPSCVSASTSATAAFTLGDWRVFTSAHFASAASSRHMTM